MSKAHALPTGLGIEHEGLELPSEELPAWEESKIKVYPMVRYSAIMRVSPDAQCWKNPGTGALHIQVHPCGAQSLIVDPLPEGASTEGALYPRGGEITDLKETRELLYKIQRPGIAPEVSWQCWISGRVTAADNQLVYPQDWDENDMVLFHNRGVLHSVMGAFTPDQLRMFHQVSRLLLTTWHGAHDSVTWLHQMSR